MARFSSRNQFDSYIVQSERHRKFLIIWGQDPEKVHALEVQDFIQTG